MRFDELNNLQKAAVLIVALGIETAVEIFKNLEEREVEMISKEIAKLGNIEHELMVDVVKEFHARLLSLASAEGGLSYLTEVLERAVGPHKTMAIVRHLSEIRPFSYFEN